MLNHALARQVYHVKVAAHLKQVQQVAPVKVAVSFVLTTLRAVAYVILIVAPLAVYAEANR